MPDTTTIVVGNLTDDPEVRYTGRGRGPTAAAELDR
jgi:single-stranded DNA-binding protein